MLVVVLVVDPVLQLLSGAVISPDPNLETMRSLTFLQVPAQSYPGRQLMPDMGVLLGEGGMGMLQLKNFHQKSLK